MSADLTDSPEEPAEDADVVDGFQPLRVLGRDEYWLQDQLSAHPDLLGLGPMEIERQELVLRHGGRLDIYAKADDVRYSIEVQLGSVDASHAFRSLEYWAQNRAREPERTHIAVLVAEAIGPRFDVAMRALAERLPVVVVLLEARSDDGEVTLTPQVVIASEGLGIATTGDAPAFIERNESDWRKEAGDVSWKTFQRLKALVSERFGSAWADYSRESHISLGRGRLVWATVRFSTGSILVNLPDPDRTNGNTPSNAFDRLSKIAADVGVVLTWQPTASGGARPVRARLRLDDLSEGEVHYILEACWEAYDENVETFSERHGHLFEAGDEYGYTEDWSEFDTYYMMDYAEGGYSGPYYSMVIYWRTAEETVTIWSAPDEQWQGDEGRREFARRILVHATQSEPTQDLINKFLRGPAKEWELGSNWSLDAGELAAYLHEWGV